MTSKVKSAVAGVVALCCVSVSAWAEERVVPVPAVTIYPGDVITKEMLKDRNYPEHYRFRVAVIDNPKSLVGKTVRRTLLPGEAVPLNAIEDPKLVTRGVPTTVVFEEGGLQITGVATPMENGIAGQSIRVKNVDSGRIIIGRVGNDGRIRIGAN